MGALWLLIGPLWCPALSRVGAPPTPLPPAPGGQMHMRPWVPSDPREPVLGSYHANGESRREGAPAERATGQRADPQGTRSLSMASSGPRSTCHPCL